MAPGISANLGSISRKYTTECGETSSPHVGILCGDMRKNGNTNKKSRHGNMAGFIEFLDLSCVLGLYQAQFYCPFDSRPAIVDVELAVNALGMGANRAQSDYEFTGDLGSR
jgi:hypothetical protein